MATGPGSVRRDDGGALTPEDGRLVERLRAGDDAAFAELIERYHAPLLRIAEMYVSDPVVAEEVVQDAWIAVIDAIKRFEGRSSLRTWLSRIVTYQARSRGRRERRSVPFSALAAREASSSEAAVDPDRFNGPDHRWPGHWADRPAAWGDAERRLLEDETRRLVASALERLPLAQRLVMTLRDVEGWPSDEVSATLGVTPGNQRVLLHRARSKVRAALEAYFAEAARA